MTSTAEKPSSIVTHRVLPNVPRNTIKVNGVGKRRRSPGKERGGLVNWSGQPLAKSALLLQFAKEIVDIIGDGDMVDTQKVNALKATTFEIVASTDVNEPEICDTCDAPKTPEWVRRPARQPDWASVGAIVDIENGLSVAKIRDIRQGATSQDRLDKKNCVKKITIEVHPTLLRLWYMAGLKDCAEKTGCGVLETLTASPHAVTWSTRVSREIISDGGKMKLFDGRKQCMRCLYVLSAADVAPLVSARALTQYMGRVRHLGQVTLAILDTAEYFRKASSHGCIGKRKAGHGHDLELAITDLLLCLEIDTVVVHSIEELETLILTFTRAIAEEPIKLAQRFVDDQAQFYMRGDNKNCVVVDQQGIGLSNLWQQMLSVIPHSSLEVARALAQRLPAPRALAQAASTPEGVSQLADIGICRSGVPGANQRRLGREMAGKLALMFNEIDGNVVIGKMSVNSGY